MIRRRYHAWLERVWTDRKAIGNTANEVNRISRKLTGLDYDYVPVCTYESMHESRSTYAYRTGCSFLTTRTGISQFDCCGFNTTSTPPVTAAALPQLYTGNDNMNTGMTISTEVLGRLYVGSIK